MRKELRNPARARGDATTVPTAGLSSYCQTAALSSEIRFLTGGVPQHPGHLLPCGQVCMQ